MFVHLMKAIEHGAKIVGADGEHGRKADGGVHGVTATDPIPKAEHVRLLGLGRWPLLHGLRHRPFDHARHRPRQFSRHARWLSSNGRTFPHRATGKKSTGPHGPPRHLVYGLLRCPDRRRPTLRTISETVP